MSRDGKHNKSVALIHCTDKEILISALLHVRCLTYSIVLYFYYSPGKKVRKGQPPGFTDEGTNLNKLSGCNLPKITH